MKRPRILHDALVETSVVIAEVLVVSL